MKPRLLFDRGMPDINMAVVAGRELITHREVLEVPVTSRCVDQS